MIHPSAGLRAISVALTTVLFALGCIVEAPAGGGARKPTDRTPALSTAAPLEVQNGANLEDKVEIVRARLEPGRAVPGETVKVTAWFKVLQEIPRDYLVFVHLEDVEGRLERMNADHSPVGGTYPTSQWKKGETVADSFEVYVPAGGSVRGLNVWLGLWHVPTDTRLKLRNPQMVRNDGSDRVLLATLPIGQ